MTAELDVAEGAERSRRVAWACFYEKLEECEKLLKLNAVLEERLAELAWMIATNETLQVIEPEGELITQARKVVGVMKLRPRGQAALAKARDRVRR